MSAPSLPSGTVVVGVAADGSSDRALDWAVEQAGLERLPLSLVHAVGNPAPAWPDVGVLDLRPVYAALREDGQAVLDRAHARVSERAPELVVHELLDVVAPATCSPRSRPPRPSSWSARGAGVPCAAPCSARSGRR